MDPTTTSTTYVSPAAQGAMQFSRTYITHGVTTETLVLVVFIALALGLMLGVVASRSVVHPGLR